VDYAKCSYNSCGRPCIEFCPVTITNRRKKGKVGGGKLKPAIDFKKSTNQIIIHSEICIQCGICINKCPKNAIYVKNIVEEENAGIKIHQYGKDSFRLYNFPTLVQGRVTGLCGPNGIGKTTILNILSLKIKPNFGDFENLDMSWQEIARKIKDNNIRNHFLEASKGFRKIKYKRQVLEILFKEYKGKKVKEILEEKLAENRNLSENYVENIYSALDINAIEDRYLEQCSGGELQRFALASILLSDADVYLIDEPVTFLDVKKRIKLAELLSWRAKGMNEGNKLNLTEKTILVVEHDLAILDYMSDAIHLFYGQPHQFGVITRVQSVKAGINSYLNGYLKSENLQFRNNKIKFRKTISGRSWANAIIFSKWPKLKKKFDNFELDVFPGELYQNEILGVVGENGLGKTTFIRLLLGYLTPDEGEMNYIGKFALSYKPQYITRKYNGSVADFIHEYSGEYIYNDILIEKIYEPLGVDKIFDAPVSDLSGGQLQRTFIAACLSKDANIYLIDEPSAYLDVEERLKISEIIRTHIKSSNASAICIEHDIQILDALADRMLLFLGEPGKHGYSKGPLNKREGMNLFLKTLDVTFRRDEETGRARINKKGSHLDKKQRAMGEYYYVKISNSDNF